MAGNMLGFDIGAASVKIVSWNGWEITRAVEAPTPDNLVKEGVIVSYDAMADFIKETMKAQKLKGGPCAVVLPSSFSFLRRITMPAMTVDQLAVNLPYEFRDFLTEGKDKYFYDYAVYEIKNDEDGKPKEMELIAAAVAKSTIDDYRAMFRRAGLRLATAVPTEGVYSNLIARMADNASREYAILDLGHTGTRLDIFTGNRFETTRMSEIGLVEVDRLIADGVGVDSHIARTYKHTNHQGLQESEAAQGVYAAIATDARKAVNFYGFNNRESELRDLWCCGGGTKIPALCSAVAEATGLELHPIEELFPPMTSDAENPAAFAAAIGAAIQ